MCLGIGTDGIFLRLGHPELVRVFHYNITSWGPLKHWYKLFGHVWHRKMDGRFSHPSLFLFLDGKDMEK